MLKELLYITLFVLGVGLASMIGVFSVGERVLRSAMSTASTVGATLLSSPFSAVFVTVPNADVAKTISRGLVKNKLAACVNIIPGITSIYEWEGSINEDPELILMIKTRTSRVDELTKFVRENHPYSVCEVIATSIDKGNPAYLEWIGASVPELTFPVDNQPSTSSSGSS